MMNTHTSKSTMPNVLEDYGHPGNQQKTQKKKRQRERKKSFVDEEYEARREQQRTEHYLNVVKDVEKLRDYYYEKYMELMHERVENQREEIKKREKLMEKRQQRKEKRREKMRLESKAKHQFHKLESDDDYMKTVSKSYMYEVLKIERKLKTENKLKSQMEVDRFWEEVENFYPDVDLLKESMRVLFPDRPKPVVVPPKPTSPTNKQASRDLYSLEEEPSRPETSQSGKSGWAVTQMATHKHKPGLFTGKDPKSKTPQSSKSKSDIIVFPKLEYPKLHCFTMDLSKKEADPEEEILSYARRIREAQRRLNRKKLQRMYQFAMTHSASTQRILEKHNASDNLHLLLNGAEVRDNFCAYESESSSDDEEGDQILWRRSPPSDDFKGASRGFSIITIPEENESEYSRSKSTASRKSSAASSKSSLRQKSDMSLKHEPLPLTLDSILPGVKQVEAKCLSTFWTNYSKDTNVSDAGIKVS